MKLSERTIGILKNFSTVNQNILLKAGKKIETWATLKNIVAHADIDESIPNEFGIFNLPEFLGVYSLFGEPDLTFSANELTLKEGKNTVRYVAADKSILVYPDKTIKMPAPDVSFDLSQEQINSIMKASAALSVPDISFVGNGKNVVVRVHNKTNPSSNQYIVDLEVPSKQIFTVNFKLDNFKQIADNYSVELSSKNISRFIGKAVKVTYYIAVEEDTTFA